MKTLVFQSYKAQAPEWIVRCMHSVRAWSVDCGYEYRFFDDGLFEILPNWFLNAYRGRMLPLTDLARALHARRLLEEGWNRAIWIDADVLVFLPGQLKITTEGGYALCSELWCEKKWGELLLDRRVNNCISVYEHSNPFLPFYIEAMQALALAKGATLTDWDIGTNFLSSLGRITPLPLLGDIAMLSPTLAGALASDDASVLRRFTKETGRICSATNLCASALDKMGPDRASHEARINALVDLLLRTEGAALNRYLVS